jgi:hypothetical protein
MLHRVYWWTLTDVSEELTASISSMALSTQHNISEDSHLPSFSHSECALRPPSLCVRETLSVGIKRLQREAENSSLFTAEFKNAWRFASI